MDQRRLDRPGKQDPVRRQPGYRHVAVADLLPILGERADLVAGDQVEILLMDGHGINEPAGRLGRWITLRTGILLGRMSQRDQELAFGRLGRLWPQGERGRQEQGEHNAKTERGSVNRQRAHRKAPIRKDSVAHAADATPHPPPLLRLLHPSLGLRLAGTEIIVGGTRWPGQGIPI